MIPRPHLRDVNPATALRTGARLLWERSASVLPVYLLASGLYGAARAPLVVAGIAAVWLLAAGGRLDPFLEQLRAAEGGSVGPESGGGVGEALSQSELGSAVAGLLTPSVLLLIAGGALVAAALAVLASAVGNAAAVSGLLGLLRGNDGVHTAVTGVRRHWRSFLGVRLLLLAAIGAVLVPAVGVVATVIGVVSTGSTGGVGAAAVGAGVTVLAGLVVALLVAGVLVLFAFADQAIVVDDVGAGAAVKRSFRFPLRRPAAVLGYVAVAVGALLVSAVGGSLAATAGAPRAAALVGTVLVPPVVDGFKTALYADASLSSAPDVAPPPVGTRLRSAFGDGLRSVGGFVRDHPAANLASLGCVAAGGAAGWVATASVGVDFPVGSDVSGVFGTVPVDQQLAGRGGCIVQRTRRGRPGGGEPGIQRADRGCCQWSRGSRGVSRTGRPTRRDRDSRHRDRRVGRDFPGRRRSRRRSRPLRRRRRYRRDPTCLPSPAGACAAFRRRGAHRGVSDTAGRERRARRIAEV